MSLALRKVSLLPLLALGVGLSGCDNLEDDGPGNSAGTVASFSPSVGVTSSSSTLFFSVSTAAATNDPSLADSTLNIPSSSPPAVAANKLDGFSTGSPVAIPMSVPVDPASVQAGVNVHLIHICMNALLRTPIGAGTQGVLPATDFEVSVSKLDPTQILIKPTKPLLSMNPVGSSDCAGSPMQSASSIPSNGYMVALTKGIRATNGTEFGIAPFYQAVKAGNPSLHDGTSRTAHAVSLGLQEETAKFLERIRPLFSGLEGLASQVSGQAINPADIIMTTAFPTQSVGLTLKTLRAGIGSKASALVNSGQNTPASAGKIWGGILKIDYYLTAGSHAQSTDPLTKNWEAAPIASGPGAGSTNLTFRNTTPVATSEQTIPMLAAIPQSAATPMMDVAIFQHGITRNRADMLAIADKLNSRGIAVVAIDLPLHGILATDATAFLRNPQAPERTFELDLVNNASGAAGPDGNPDASGTHFINLSQLLVSRDNIRQGAADLMQLNKVLRDGIPELDAMGNPTGNMALQATKVYFVGHSLGAITGITYLGNIAPGDITAATLAMPGASIPKLLDGSSSFAPRIAAGLAASGVESGTPAYETFMSFAQQAVDAADPINYIEAAKANTQLHLIEVVGDGAANLPDVTVPNKVVEGDIANGAHTVFESAPLAGTDPLAAILGSAANDAGDTTTRMVPNGDAAVFKATSGDHSSILMPSTAIGAEMQNQTLEWLRSDGSCIVINATAAAGCPVP